MSKGDKTVTIKLKPFRARQRLTNDLIKVLSYEITVRDEIIEKSTTFSINYESDRVTDLVPFPYYKRSGHAGLQGNRY